MKCLSFLIPLIVALPTFAGDSKGNGGDVVNCTRSESNSFEGQYSLDYILGYRASNENADIVNAQSWEASKQRILLLLEQKSAYLAKSFKNFLEHSENFNDFTKKRVWDESSFGLVDLKDENIRRKLPNNCGINKAVGDLNNIELVQAVTRRIHNDKVVYEFDYRVYHHLKTLMPLQFSFLMVHEWLWDITNDPWQIRRLNRIFHSTELETLSKQGFEQIFTSITNLPLNLPLKEGLYKYDKSADNRSCRMKLTYDFGMKIKITAFRCKHDASVEGKVAYIVCRPTQNAKPDCYEQSGTLRASDSIAIVNETSYKATNKHTDYPYEKYTDTILRYADLDSAPTN